jgi:FkbM family methyltransferase
LKIKQLNKYNFINVSKTINKLLFYKRGYSFIVWIKNKFPLFEQEERIVNFKNRFFLNLNLNDWIQNQIFFLDSYEDFELNVLEFFLKPGDNFIDIGSNFGLYSLWSSAIIGNEGKIFSFEPFYENYLALEKNINLNHFNNIIVEKIAITDYEGELCLSYNNKENNLGMVSFYETNREIQERVICNSLDNYLVKNPINSIKYIKIDIEGGEYLALLGMKETLKKFKPIVQLEIDYEILLKTPYNRENIFDFMTEINYEVFIPNLINQSKVKPNSYSKNCFFKCKFEN